MASVRRGTISNTASSDGEVCAVCGGGADAGAFVDCDACDVRVHQGCYGVVGAPPRRWFCDPCQSGRRGSRAAHADPKCGLCGTHGGGLKRVGRKGWAHVCCVLWTPELEVDDAMCAVDLDVGPERAATRCDVCGRGNAVRCGHAGCRAAVHASCALKASTPFALSTAGEDPDTPFEVLCARHRRLTQSPRASPREVVDLTADSPQPRRSVDSSIASPSPPPRRLRRLRKNHAPELPRRGSSASAALSFVEDEASQEAADAALARRLQAEEDARAADSDSDGAGRPPPRRRAPRARRRPVASEPRRRRRAVAESEDDDDDDVLDDEAACSDGSSDESDHGSADDRKAARDSLLNDESEDDGGFDHSRFDLSRRSSASLGAALGRGGSKRMRRGGVLQAALQHASGGGDALDFEDAYNSNRYRDTRSFSSGGGDAGRYLDTDDEDDDVEDDGWTRGRAAAAGEDDVRWADRRLPTVNKGSGWSDSDKDVSDVDDVGDDWGGRFRAAPPRRKAPPARRKKKKSSFEATAPPPGRAPRRGPRKSSFRIPVPVARKRALDLRPASQLSQEAPPPRRPRLDLRPASQLSQEAPPPRRSHVKLVPAAVALSQGSLSQRRSPPPPPVQPRRPPPPALRPANASGGGGLTEEQKARIARNKAAALERQRARLRGL